MNSKILQMVYLTSTIEKFSLSAVRTQELQIMEKNGLKKKTLRHELIHAFLAESGLSANALSNYTSWAENEEMVDWIAIQFPKILEVFKEVDCL